jgi:hypothetical protein
MTRMQLDRMGTTALWIGEVVIVEHKPDREFAL